MNKKKIIVVQRNYAVGIEAGDKVRTLNMANSLVNLGYEVFLVGFFTRGLLLYNKEKKRLPRNMHSFLIFSLPTSFGLHKLAGWYQSFIIWLLVKLYKIDVIQAELSHAAVCAKLLPQIPLVTDFHSDLVPEFEMANMSKYRIKQAVKDNEWAIKRSSVIITVSKTLYRNLSEYGNIKKNFVLPCNFDTNLFGNTTFENRNVIKERLGIPLDKIVLCYSGGLHVWQCIDETIDLVIRLKSINPNYFFCLFTNDDVSKFKSKLDLLNGDYIVKGIKRGDMPKYLSVIDAGFVLRADSKVNTNASPTKTSEYLAVGAMAIATPYSGDATELIKESSCGFIISDLHPSDEEVRQLNNTIVNYTSNYSSCSNFAKSYIFENRAWKKNEELLKSVYEYIFR